MKQNFIKTLSQYQSATDKKIKLFFDKEISESKNPFLTETLKILREYSLRPAKRVRAILVNLGYSSVGGKKRREIIKTSVFIELIHNFLLAHDDIIDREKNRRGGMSLHNQYSKEVKAKDEEKNHYGTSMAVVAGDMMEFLGRKILAESPFSDDCKIKAIKKLDEILIATAYGEMFEFSLRKKMKEGKKISEKDVLDVYKTKTAFYTFIGPLQMGALLARADRKALESFEKIGLPLGIAFQIMDDLEDVTVNIKEEQPNLLLLKILAKKQGKVIKKYLGKETNRSDAKNIISVIAESGAEEECRQMAKNFIETAKKEITKAKYSSEDKIFLTNLADYIISR